LGICEPAGSGRSLGGCLACPCQDPPIPRSTSFPPPPPPGPVEKGKQAAPASRFIGIAKRKSDLPVGRKREVQPDWPPVGARGGRPGLTGRHAGVQGLGHCGQAGPHGLGRREAKASWAVGGGQGAAGAALQRTRKLRGGPSRPASGPTQALKVRRAAGPHGASGARSLANLICTSQASRRLTSPCAFARIAPSCAVRNAPLIPVSCKATDAAFAAPGH
jgi:hypothetical protein